jgi:hypothetical protein
MIILTGILVWTILSIIWAVKSIGKKCGTNKWYDYILSPPALVIAGIIGVVSHRKELWCLYFKGHDFVQHPQNEQIYTCSKCKKVERRIN